MNLYGNGLAKHLYRTCTQEMMRLRPLLNPDWLLPVSAVPMNTDFIFWKKVLLLNNVSCHNPKTLLSRKQEEMET